MKTIGLLGGMSWESTQLYYQLINREVQRRLGGVHSARCIVYSVDFAEIEALQAAGDWATSGRLLGEAASKLRAAGAEILVLCTNTMHLVAEAIERISGMKLLDIFDITAEAVKHRGIESVGLLGTGYTMSKPFYRERLERHGLRVIVPSEPDRTRVHEIIYDELVRGVVRDDSRAALLEIVDRLRTQGAAGVILGCTEIGMLVRDGDASVPCFDTTELHATATVEKACAD
jgi:aspartate racemase